MAVGDLVVDTWEVEYRGLKIGGDSPYMFVRIEGLADLPEVRSADRPLLRRHGLHPSTDFMSGREVTLTFDIKANSEAEFNELITDLQRAFRVTSQPEEPMVLMIPGIASGLKARIYARTRYRSIPIGLEWLYKNPLATIRLACTDPRVYSDAEQSGTTGLSTISGGLTFPIIPPITFGAPTSGNIILAENVGTTETPWVARIDGPVINPSIENVTSGTSLEIDISLGTGDFLILDSAHRTIMLNGTASRYNLLTTDSVWADLEPGTNEIKFRSGSYSAGTLTLYWRSAWV